MLQDAVNYLAPLAVLLVFLGFNDARIARKREKASLQRVVELEAELDARLVTIDDLALTIAQLEAELDVARQPIGVRARAATITDFASVTHNGMAYFMAGAKVMRAPIGADGFFLLGDAIVADPTTCDDVDPLSLLSITEQLEQPGARPTTGATG